MDQPYIEKVPYQSFQPEILRASAYSFTHYGEVGNCCIVHLLCAEPGDRINGICEPKLLPFPWAARMCWICQNFKTGNSDARPLKSPLRNFLGHWTCEPILPSLRWCWKLGGVLDHMALCQSKCHQQGVSNLPTRFSNPVFQSPRIWSLSIIFLLYQERNLFTNCC